VQVGGRVRPINGPTSDEGGRASLGEVFGAACPVRLTIYHTGKAIELNWL